MDPLLWQALITGLFVLAGVMATYIQTGKARKSGDSNSSVDQLQENWAATRDELVAMRVERALDRDAAIREREKDRVRAEEARIEIDYLVNCVNAMEDELGRIYDGVRTGHIPPLPPRTPRLMRPPRAHL